MNRRIVLAARPNGAPTERSFRLEATSVPSPAEGQVLLQTVYLSLDPYMRELMNEVPPAYAPSVVLGEPMPGATVSRVVVSRNSRFRADELVLAATGWQDYALSDGNDLTSLGEMAHPSYALGGLGMTGFTAYVGLLDIGRPKAGETVVVAAATGAVGSVVGQVARIKGARVVGIAGGAQKCRYAIDELGFTDCIDRHDAAFATHLANACPNGIDVYFENVGGAVFDAVLPLLNNGARVAVCGNIAHYNDGAAPAGPDRLPKLISTVLQKRIHMQGLVILDHYGQRFEAFRHEMSNWVTTGKVKLLEERVEGLENAAPAFAGLLAGRNLGKVIVRVSNPESSPASPPSSRSP
jgi:NADPH-dependent curcumin reductase